MLMDEMTIDVKAEPAFRGFKGSPFKFMLSRDRKTIMPLN
jgi:hypothetical protein